MGNGNNMKNGDDADVPPHRPLVGGGSAAAYEAARDEHYRQLAENKRNEDKDDSHSNDMGLPMPNPMVNMGGGSNMGGGNDGGGLNGLSINANQHYEMLKLHHMNLLNEIQETTLMMNIYQQQQLQQQQQQLQQQQANTEGGEQMVMLLQQGSSGSGADFGRGTSAGQGDS